MCLLAPCAQGQDFVYYTFDDAVGNEVVNYAHGAAALSGNGVLETNTGAASLEAGRFGHALVGGDPGTGSYHRVRTGWIPSQRPLVGDLTIAFWLRQRTPSGSMTVLSGTTLASGFRMYTGGSAGRGLYQRGIVANGGNGSNRVDMRLPPSVVDVQTLAATRWTHIALVVDSAAGAARWFVDGTDVLTVCGVGPAHVVSTGEYLIGFQGSQNVSNYDHDEFLISQRAYSRGEIQALATGPHAGDGGYTSGVPGQCGTATISSYGGAPVFGNANYGIELGCPAPGLFLLLAGFDRQDVRNGASLPLQLGGIAPGCWLLTDVAIRPYAGVTQGGPVRVPLQLPGGPIGGDLRLFVQGVVLGRQYDDGNGGTGPGLHASMGLAISIGN